MNLKGRTAYFTLDDTIPKSYLDGDYEGQVIVFAESVVERFKEPYRKPEFQLLYSTGGFGAKPDTIGSAVFGQFVADGESVRYRRGDFIGILKPELVKEYEIDMEALKNGE